MFCVPGSQDLLKDQGTLEKLPTERIWEAGKETGLGGAACGGLSQDLPGQVSQPREEGFWACNKNLAKPLRRQIGKAQFSFTSIIYCILNYIL